MTGEWSEGVRIEQWYERMGRIAEIQEVIVACIIKLSKYNIYLKSNATTDIVC